MGHKPWDRAWRRASKARERNTARAEMLAEADTSLSDLGVTSAAACAGADRAAHLIRGAGTALHDLDDVIAELGLTQAEIDTAR